MIDISDDREDFNLSRLFDDEISLEEEKEEWAYDSMADERALGDDIRMGRSLL